MHQHTRIKVLKALQHDTLVTSEEQNQNKQQVHADTEAKREHSSHSTDKERKVIDMMERCLRNPIEYNINPCSLFSTKFLSHATYQPSELKMAVFCKYFIHQANRREFGSRVLQVSVISRYSRGQAGVVHSTPDKRTAPALASIRSLE